MVDEQSGKQVTFAAIAHRNSRDFLVYRLLGSDRRRNRDRGKRIEMRVVLDTSVLVAAARSRLGASSALLLRLLDRTFVPAISVPLFVEYEATLLRSENLLDRLINAQ